MICKHNATFPLAGRNWKSNNLHTAAIKHGQCGLLKSWLETFIDTQLLGRVTSACILKFFSSYIVSVMAVIYIKSRIQWYRSQKYNMEAHDIYQWHKNHHILYICRQCSECDQASSDDADIAMETLPDGTKRSRRQIKGPIKFIPQEMSPEPKKHQVRGTVCGDK